MRIALVVDSPKRDLDGIILVAYHLALHGVEALLVPMYQQGYDLPLLRADGVILNYARENNRELLDLYRRLGIRVMVLDTEGGVLSENGLDSPENWASEMRRSGLGRAVDEYFFWGTRLHEAFSRESGIPGSNLHVTGCPRYDFCAPPWRKLLAFRTQGYALVNTNFSAINPRFTASKESEMAIFHGLGWASEYVSRLFADLEGVFPRYLDTIEALARSGPAIPILVRPHPFENEEMYKRRFASVPNVTVDGSGNVLPMIANAACVLHLNCGTAIESLMLGTPAISLELLNSETMRSHAALPSKVSLAAESMGQLQEYVADRGRLKAVQDKRRDRLLTQYIEPWFHRIDGRAAERVAASAIAAVAERLPVGRSFRAALRGGRSPSLGRMLAGAASQIAGSRIVETLQGMRIPARRAKAVGLEAVQVRVAQLCALAQPGIRLAVDRARHPISGVSMASVRIRPQQ